MKISLLVPYRPNGPRDTRVKTWRWLKERWRTLLPEAELCVGTDDGGHPFSKARAVNDAYRKSTGDLLVIADADSWVERPQLEIGMEAAARHEHLVIPWFVSYRLTKQDSNEIMRQDPSTVLPVTLQMKEAAAGTGPAPDSAAMVIIILRSGFERVGGMDERFRGWGSEDVSFGLSCWTLLGRPQFGIGEAYALYHPRPMAQIQEYPDTRVWKNDPGNLNLPLWQRYKEATGYPEKMLQLCREHPLDGKPVSKSPTWRQDDMVPFKDVKEKEGTAFVTPRFIPDVREDQPIARESVL